MTKFVPKEVLGDSTFVAVYDPESGDTGYARMGDLVDKSETTVTAAVRNAVQYIVSHADLDARPPRLWPVSAVPHAVIGKALGYAWAFYDSSDRRIAKIDPATYEVTPLYEFPATERVASIHECRTGLLILTQTIATNVYRLWRSDDGVDVTPVHTFGSDPDGAGEIAGVQLMARGIGIGKIKNRDALLMATYTITADGIDGTAGDAIYLSYSFDDGRTWERLNTWNWDYDAGVGARKIRHFHAVRYDEWRNCWWIAAGDTDAQSAVIRWDGQDTTPIGNVSPEQIASGAYPGWACRWGSQRWRAVDIIVTEDWIETYTDTVAVETGGIWRVRPDLTGSHRVNHASKNQQRDGWFGLLTSSGARYWTGNVREDELTPENRYVAVYGSANGNRYFEIGRVAVKADGKCNPREIFELNGKVWLCVTGNVGKPTGETAIFELRGKFREDRADNLAPVFFVNYQTGTDSTNLGGTPDTAFKTLSHALQGSRLVPGARVMLASGASAEAGHNTIVYDNNAVPAGDTLRHVQVSGQGASGPSKTTLIYSALARGANNKLWSVELTDCEVLRSEAGSLLFNDYTTCVSGSGWTLRDCIVGNETTNVASVCSFSSTSFKAIRCRIATTSNGTNRAVRSENTANVVLESTVLIGLVSQAASSKITAKHCDFSGAGTSNSFRLEATSTVVPVIANCIFTSTSPASPILNLSAQTLTSVDVYGCAYSTNPGSGIPDPILAAADIMDRDEDTKAPFAWSALAGVAQPAGVAWDYYGNPFRARPTIGAVEIPPAI